MFIYFIPSNNLTYILIDLDIEMRKKLVILLKNQMSRVLTQINEGMEDQEEWGKMFGVWLQIRLVC